MRLPMASVLSALVLAVVLVLGAPTAFAIANGTRKLQQLPPILGISIDLLQNRQAPSSKQGNYLNSPDPGTPDAPNTFAAGPFKGEQPKYLYVWAAYGASYTNPLTSGIPLTSFGARDFLLAVDLNPYNLDGVTANPNYGKYISFTKLPSIGNEPHHLSINYKRTRLLGGGLLSFLQQQFDLFLFHLDDQRNPVYAKNNQLLTTAVTDHIFGRKEGGFLTTQMGSKVGATPGGLSLWDDDLNLQQDLPGGFSNVPLTGFNPHGADIKAEDDLLVNSNFVNPVTTVTSAAFTDPLGVLDLSGLPFNDALSLADIETRSTVNVWRYSQLSNGVLQTINLQGAQGVIDVKIIPGTFIQTRANGINAGVNLAYATGVFGNTLYLVNVSPKTYQGINTNIPAYTAIQVFSFSNLKITAHSVPGKSYQLPAVVHPHLLAPAVANTRGTRFFLSLNKAGVFLYINSTIPESPVILDYYVLTGPNPPAPHYVTPISASLANRYVALADYFLDQGAIGAIHAGGNKLLYVLRYDDNAFEVDSATSLRKPLILDIGNDWYGRPHGISTNVQYTDVDTQGDSLGYSG